MKKLFIFILIFLTARCTENKPDKPAGLISANKMSIILEEVLLIEGYFQSKYGVPGVYKEALDASVKVVLKKHRVSKKQFKESYSFYASQTDEFKNLNTSIMDRLSRQVP